MAASVGKTGRVCNRKHGRRESPRKIRAGGARLSERLSASNSAYASSVGGASISATAISPAAIAATVSPIAAVAIQSIQVIRPSRFTVRAWRTVRTRLAGRISPPSSLYDREPDIADDRRNPQTYQHPIHGSTASLDVLGII